MRVLGIDPGYAIVGWGVVEYAGNRFAPVDFGAVCTDAGVPFERRLDEVYAGIKEVIERTKPEVLAIEKLFYQHNQTTVIGVAEARGVTWKRHHLHRLTAGRPSFRLPRLHRRSCCHEAGKRGCHLKSLPAFLPR